MRKQNLLSSMQSHFDFFIYLKVSKILDMHIMNVITTYINGFIDNYIYIKLHKQLKLF